MRLFSWGCEYEIIQETKLPKNSASYFIFSWKIYWSSYRYFDNWEKQMRTNIRIVDIYIRHIHKTNRSHTFFNYKCAFASPWQKYCRNPMLNCNTSSTYSLTVKKLFFFFFFLKGQQQMWGLGPVSWRHKTTLLYLVVKEVTIST